MPKAFDFRRELAIHTDEENQDNQFTKSPVSQPKNSFIKREVDSTDDDMVDIEMYKIN